MKKHTTIQKDNKLSLRALKSILKQHRRHYDLQIVDRDNEIQMLRDELASKSAMVHRNW